MARLGGLVMWVAGSVASPVTTTPPPPPPPVVVVAPPAPVVTQPAEPFGNLPPCPTEDSDNCYWDATERGNGEGRSFYVVDGEVTYLDGAP